MTLIETTPSPVTTDGDGDHDKFAHIVPKDKLTDAMVYGYEIEALCGKRWIPSRNPDNYPVCQPCAQEMQQRLGLT